MNFRFVGVERLSSVKCLSEQQFVCVTQLPLDQLCIEYNKEMFELPGQLGFFKWGVQGDYGGQWTG